MINCDECEKLLKEIKNLMLERVFLRQQLESLQNATIKIALENEALHEKCESKDIARQVYKKMYQDLGGGQEGISQVCMDCLLFDRKMAIEQNKKESGR